MSDISLPTDSIPSKGSLPGLQAATFLLSPHTAERGSSGLFFSSYKGVKLF